MPVAATSSLFLCEERLHYHHKLQQTSTSQYPDRFPTVRRKLPSWTCKWGRWPMPERWSEKALHTQHYVQAAITPPFPTTDSTQSLQPTDKHLSLTNRSYFSSTPTRIPLHPTPPSFGPLVADKESSKTLVECTERIRNTAQVASNIKRPKTRY